MLTLILASALLIIDAPGAPDKSFLRDLEQRCEREHGRGVANVNRTLCKKRKLNDAYAEGRFTKYRQAYDQRFTHEARLAREYKQGKITRNEYKKALDDWINHKRNVIEQRRNPTNTLMPMDAMNAGQAGRINPFGRQDTAPNDQDNQSSSPATKNPLTLFRNPASGNMSD